MTTIVISCILSINGKKKVQPAAGKMGHTLLSCKTGREQFQQQYFFLSSYLDCSFRKDALESLFFPTSSKYMCIVQLVYIYTLKSCSTSFHGNYSTQVLIQNSFLIYLGGFCTPRKNRITGNPFGIPSTSLEVVKHLETFLCI